MLSRGTPIYVNSRDYLWMEVSNCAISFGLALVALLGDTRFAASLRASHMLETYVSAFISVSLFGLYAAARELYREPRSHPEKAALNMTLRYAASSWHAFLWFLVAAFMVKGVALSHVMAMWVLSTMCCVTFAMSAVVNWMESRAWDPRKITPRLRVE